MNCNFVPECMQIVIPLPREAARRAKIWKLNFIYFSAMISIPFIIMWFIGAYMYHLPNAVVYLVFGASSTVFLTLSYIAIWLFVKIVPEPAEGEEVEDNVIVDLVRRALDLPPLAHPEVLNMVHFSPRQQPEQRLSPSAEGSNGETVQAEPSPEGADMPKIRPSSRRSSQ